MKLTSFLMICFLVNISAETFSQKFTFDVKRETIKDILAKIEGKSDYKFLYRSDLIDDTREIDLNVSDENIEGILGKIFDPTKVSYKIFSENLVVIASSSLQQQNITGKVTDVSTGEPIIGVNVTIEGTTIGVITDINGNFQLTRPEKGAGISFSFIGYVTQKQIYNGENIFDMKLTQDVKSLEEVVVIGYGTQKKSDLTGSVSKVSSKDMDKANPANFAEALQGRATGVMVVNSQGAPGSSGVIRIRGIGTVNNNEPLYVIDGMFAESMNDLNPSDIESMEVLKDASSQAIYGSRAANGVILITTKKGKDGRSDFTFNASYGVANPLKLVKALGNEDYYKYAIEAKTNGYLRQNPTVDPSTLDIFAVSPDARMVRSYYNLGYNTNWMDEILHRNAPEQKYDFSYAGGTTKANYLLSGGYLNQDGIVQNSNYKRYTVRINTEFSPNKIISFGENIGMSYATTKIVSSVNGSDIQSPLGGTLLADPLTPSVNPDANPYDPNYEYNKYMYDEVAAVGNPVAAVNRADNVTKNYSLTGNAFVQAKFLKGFTFKSSVGMDFNLNTNSNFSAIYYLGKGEHEDVGGLSNTQSTRSKWLWENTLNYSKTVGLHTLNALVGYTSEQRVSDNLAARKTNVTSNDPLFRVLDGISSASSVTTASGTKIDQSMASVLARINYTYSDRYLFTASVRNDGTSKFNTGYKYGTFPSFSIGWRLINENFMKSLKTGFLSDFKLRGGWGTIGNQSILQDFGYLSLVSVSDAYKYNFGSTPVVASGSALSQVGTSDMKWETTAQTNFGADLGFLKNALTLSFDYYDKQTENMLLVVALPSYVGYTSNPIRNVGGVSNKGFEISANYKNKLGDLSYNLSANFSKFSNVVTNLIGGVITGTDMRGLAVNRTQEGSSIGRFYGYQTNGIFQSADDVAAYKSSNGTVIQPLALPGDVKFKDLDGDGKITAADQSWIGSPLPDFTYGFNIDLQYKSFSVNAFFQGSQGNSIYDLNKVSGFQGLWNIPQYLYDEAWRGAGTSNRTPIFTNVDQNNNFRVSDLMVQDASYLRLKDLQLGYDLPESVCKKINFKKLRIWVGGSNILTFTKYKGVDPEDGITSSLPIAAGLVYTSYPKPRTFSFGINATF